MSKNLVQINSANPLTGLEDNDLLYVVRSNTDAAIDTQSIFPQDETVVNGDLVVFDGTSGKKFTNKPLASEQVIVGITGDTPTVKTLPKPYIAVTGTSKTLALSDAWTTQECSNAATQTITLDGSLNWSSIAPCEIDFIQAGAGIVTLAATNGMTINSTFSNKSTAAQYAGMTLKIKSSTVAYLVGNLAA